MRPHQSNGGHGGYSLIEMMIVVAMIAVLAGIAVPVSSGMITRARAESANLEVLTWLESARNRAIAERRNFEVTFDQDADLITIERVEPDDERTPIAIHALENGLTFMQFDGVDDTPDEFGDESDVEIEGDAPHMFTSDGSFIDANGDPVNGTIFLGKEDQIETAGAITVFGVTGMLRVWKLAGSSWHQ
jgi:prepilin-type N-terminal cleavage/methylation domain-containing protein